MVYISFVVRTECIVSSFSVLRHHVGKKPLFVLVEICENIYGLLKNAYH